MTTSRPFELDWYAADLRTGAILEDLQTLTAPALSRRLGEATTATFDLALDGAPRSWRSATEHGRTLLVGVDRLTQAPLWAGVVLNRRRGSATTVSLATATLETYLGRRYTGALALVGVDQGQVLAALAAVPASQGPPFVVDVQTTGTVMDYLVEDSDDRTVLSALQEVMDLEDGPEWTVDVAWNTARNGFVFPLRGRARIGLDAPEGVFDFPGAVTAYEQEESYEDGRGATIVQAYGEGEGPARLTSGPLTADDLLAGGWCRWVYRYTPATGITDPDALASHARRDLAAMRTGSSVWSLEATASRAPRLGTDWSLGDTVRLQIAASPGHPDGATVAARAWAWELDPAADTVRPILVEE
ncbi:hypothetical protein GCM10010406_52890 [Streptomyces thermolineatus]|uniref:Uncharacterized protein n=1 Tax=Streptomyces thermolineatus TaxID=44033 RepID=A0ABP6A3A8_9ACTN